VKSLKFGVPSSYVFDGIDRQTGSTFECALTLLSEAGVKIVPVEMPELNEIPSLNAKGGLAAREACLFHRDWMKNRASEYDPLVLVRIRKGETQTDEDYRQVQSWRRSLMDRIQIRLRDFDAVVMPTVPMIAPRIDDLSSEDEYNRVNMLMLRNCTVANILDRCAVSLPCHLNDEAPVGFMLMGENMGDHKLLATAATIERIFDSA
jgi:aspartyl-tRNA(Asn)/glutamyl-tRNA(Gln) amidotransferase subunit A